MVVPAWKWAKHKRKQFRYWCGDLNLSGEKSKKEWRMTLHVAAWAESLERFVSQAENAGYTDYLGQDWR
jgi:hypothetical protein